MSINILKYIFFFSLGILVSLISNGQIKAPTADRIDSTEYTLGDTYGKDPIYFFYTPNENNHDVGGDLTANYNNSDLANYYWFKYTKSTDAFDSLVFTEENVVSSKYYQQVFDTAGSGYRVQIENIALGIDTSWHGWVFLNTFQLQNPVVRLSTCDRMELKTTLIFDSEFEYIDLTNPDTILTKYNELDTLFWTTNEEYPYTLPRSLTPGFPAPTTPTKFTITITDNFEHSVKKYIDITKEEPLDDFNAPQLRAVKADFEGSVFDPNGNENSNNNNNNEDDSVKTVTGEAPLKVQFINNSENAELFFWTFNTHIDYERDPFSPDTVKATSEYERPLDSILYDFPGTYPVRLEVEGPIYYTSSEEKRCKSTKYIVECVKVDSVFMPTFMNVFTPNNGDDINNRFYFENGEQGEGTFKEPTSIKEFSIKIYSRWGNRVHEYTGIMEDWEGWEGDTIGLGYAETGVYYYVAIFTGYDNRLQKREGFIHLFK